MDHDPSQSLPIVIPRHDEQVSTSNPSTQNPVQSQHDTGQFVPESFQTARSFKTSSPQDFPFQPSSVNSTHSQVQNNSYSHQFVNNFNNLRNPFTSASPTANFSPRADPPVYSQRHGSFVDTGGAGSFASNPGFAPTSGARASLLTSKLASSNAQQLPIPGMRSPPQYEQHQTNPAPPTHMSSSFSHSSEFPGRSSNIEIQPPTTSSHFKQSEHANSYTPYHNTPSVVSSSYSSAANSIPNHFQYNQPHSFQAQSLQNQQNQPGGVSSSFPSFASHFPRNPPNEPATKSVGFDADQNKYVDYQKQMKQSSDALFNEKSDSDNSKINVHNSSLTDAASNTASTTDGESDHLDIVNHPVDDLLLMLSALLQKIIEANDTLHPHHYHNASKFHDTNKFTANVLAFHGRNVPAISIHAYLGRILKYCPVTNEVFLTLLVYFDRIAKRANVNTGSNHGVDGEVEEQFNNNESDGGNTSVGDTAKGSDLDNQLFVMDSYNIHRLIISGITVASKFFSDIFYKNSRYAKVGGLPLDELNHLELQFLLLLDFRLLIQIEELQRYADLLLKFWKREQAKKESGE